MARTWLSIRVDLVEGGGHESIWPRPGRIFAAARSHTFAQLATAIDDAFARWDRSHLHSFDLEGALLTGPFPWDDPPEGSQPSDRVKLSRLELGEQFVYTFDLGDDWTHLCTVAESRIDPLDQLGIIPDSPLPYWGWGDIPD
jgi:Plasmid pRiA4b ORF-3-like protein